MDHSREDFEKSLCYQDALREPDIVRDTWTFWICDACRNETEEPYSFSDGEILLCGTCILAAVNRYWMRRSGKFWSWKNPQIIDPYYRKPITAKVRKQVLERDAYRCRYCGDFKDLVLDHVIPYVRTQDHSPDNLVTACNSCNAAKQDRTPEEAGMTLLPQPEV